MEDPTNVQPITTNRKLHHLLLSAALEESGSSGLVLWTIGATCGSILLLIIWAAITPIREIAIGHGFLRTISDNYTLQYLEGGVVDKILVEEGQVVRKGQDLILMNPAAAMSELGRLQNRENGFRMDLARLHAFIEDKPLTMEMLDRAVVYPEATGFDMLAQYKKDVMELYYQQVENKRNLESIVRHKIADLEQTKFAIDSQIANLQGRISSRATELGIYKELQKTDSVPILNLLGAQDRLGEVEGDLINMMKTQQNNEAALKEERENLKIAGSEILQRALEDMNTINSQLTEVRSAIKNWKDKVQRLAILSPVNGITKGIKVNEGSSVPPNGPLLDIVPIGEEMIAEVQVSTQDIGFVKLNEPAEVKVATYNYSQYGYLNGRVMHISASTFFTEKQLPYYKVLVSLDKNYLGDDPKQNLILPGMTVTAEILSGEKTLIAYIFKPIERLFSSAFHER